MTELKENWKKVGQDFGSLGKDLGKSIVNSVKTGAKVVSDWANKDDEQKEEPKADVVIEPEEKKEKSNRIYKTRKRTKRFVLFFILSVLSVSVLPDIFPKGLRFRSSAPVDSGASWRAARSPRRPTSCCR